MVKFLIIGYYAMSNFGSEVRLHVIIETLKKIRPDCHIKVVSLLDFKEEQFEHVEFVKLHNVSLLNPLKLLPQIMWADVVINGEGIPFTDFVGKGFLAFFLPILYMAHRLGKKTICYSFDIDHLSNMENRLTRRILDDTDLLIVRTPDSAEQLHEIGLSHKVFTTADPALLFDKCTVPIAFQKTKRMRIGLVLMDLYCFPIVAKIIGRKEDLYSYPYYFTYANKGKEKLKVYIKRMAKYARHLVETYDAEVYILVIDHFMDFKVSDTVYHEIGDDENVKFITFGNHTIDEMQGIISTLDFIISHRLHALISALRFNIPMIGLEADERFKYFFDYIGHPKYCLDYRKKRDIHKLDVKTRSLIKNSKIKGELATQYKKLRANSRKTKGIVQKFLDLHY